MENMENVVLNGDVMVDGADNAVNAGLGKTVAKIGLTAVTVALGVKGAIWLGKKVKNAFVSKKAKNTEIVVEDYEEVPCENEA